MKHKAGHVDPEIGRSSLHDLTLHVDLDKAGGCDLVVQHAKGIDEKMFCVLTDANLQKKRKHLELNFLVFFKFVNINVCCGKVLTLLT